MAEPQGSGSAFIGLASVGIFRQIGLLIGLAASVALGVSLVLWAGSKDYKPLDGNFATSDLMQVTQVLDSNQIAYKVDAANGVVLVESGQINNARIKLAAAGMLGSASSGFDSLEKNENFGSSQFMETARYRHALESELAKTIANISNVRSARVHLAIPQHSAFIREEAEPSASVLIERYSGRTLDADQVLAIENLVASSVPEMSAKNVTVVDQNGSLLSSRADDPEIAMAAKQLDYTHEVEKTMLQRINHLLTPIVGVDNFKAEVSATIDFSQSEQTNETYNPETASIRSEKSLLEKNGTAAEVGGIPGALSNQPPPTGAAPEVLNKDAAKASDGKAADAKSKTATAENPANATRKEDLRNYELDRTISYTKHPTGKVQRLTVAVVVDDQKKTGEGADATKAPWKPEDLERLTLLVKGAVGFSAERGDSVSVVNSAFTPVEVAAAETVPLWKQEWLLALIKPVVSGLVIILLIFGLLRPVFKRLAEVPPPVERFVSPELLAAETTGASAAMSLPAPDSSYDNQLSAVKGMITNDSERVAQVIKQWVAED